MEQSIPAQMVEALIHSSMEQVDSRCSSASNRSSLILDWPENPDEIQVITIDSDDEDYEK